MIEKNNWRLLKTNKKYWGNLLIIAVFSFFLSQFGYVIKTGQFPTVYGQDFLAFWTIGKIAGEKGYSQIYDPSNFRTLQVEEFISLGFPLEIEDPSFSPMVTPILPFFVPLFAILAKMPSVYAYWLWTIISLLGLVGYLIFFLQRTKPIGFPSAFDKKVLLLTLFSFPVFNHLLVGQANFILVICIGEFIRNSINNKPVESGFWLGGLLLKPQILILIIPILLFCRYWKVFIGFICAAGIVFLISLMLSGLDGITSMVKAWAGSAALNSTNAPQYMINWRMIGVNLNELLGTPLGWIITGFGIVLTVFALGFLVKHHYPYGSPQWIILIMSVFCATLVVTWHSHSSMAMVIIPFLLYSILSKLLTIKFAFFWMLIPFVAMIVSLLIKLLFHLSVINIFINFFDLLPTFSVFTLILLLFGCIIQFTIQRGIDDYGVL